MRVLEHFLSFLVAPQTHKIHNMLVLMLDPHFEGLGLVIQYGGKERTFQVASDYDIQVLFPLLIYAYKVLNPTNASEKNAGGSASQSSQCSSLYDVMDMDEDMALSVVKEQLIHFMITKVTKEECKDPLAWWKAHEVQFSYVKVWSPTNLGDCWFPNRGKVGV